MATARQTGQGASVIHTEKAKAIIVAAILKMVVFVFRVMDFFSMNSARCFLYKSDCRNQSCSRFDPLAKQKTVSM